MLSPSFPPAPEEAFYDPLVKFLKLDEGSPFWRESSVPLLSLPGSPNPFRVSPGGSKASSNPFKERVWEPPLTNNGKLGEAERLLQAEVRDLTFRNVFLAMEMNKLKEQLESAGRVPKRLCRGSFKYIAVYTLSFLLDHFQAIVILVLPCSFDWFSAPGHSCLLNVVLDISLAISVFVRPSRSFSQVRSSPGRALSNLIFSSGERRPMLLLF